MVLIAAVLVGAGLLGLGFGLGALGGGRGVLLAGYVGGLVGQALSSLVE